MDLIKKRVVSLPFAQQVALYVILRMPGLESKGFSFLSSEFASAFKPYVRKHVISNLDEYGKFIGGILSGLMRNKILSKLSGDRDKLWTLNNEVKENVEKYRNTLFEIKVYWK
ncbi:MAG: hypothetical protein AAB875_07455 [Patescibacteria group bacterium]